MINKTKNKIIFLGIFTLLFISILPIFKGKNLYNMLTNENNVDKYEANISEERKSNYNKMMVDDVKLKTRITGTEPFNEGKSSDEFGVDISPSDEYVRTFDVVKYTLEVAISPNTSVDGVESDSIFNGGVIKVKAKLPNQGEKKVFTWQEDAWMKNVSFNEDKTEIYAEYHVPSNVSISNANQNLTFTVLTSGYKEQITKDMMPTFKVWMEGNKEDNSTSSISSIEIKDELDTLIVSGKESLDVDVKPSTFIYKGELDGVRGEYVAFGVGVALYQPVSNFSDLRGVTYPEGPITIELGSEYLARNISSGESDYKQIEDNSTLVAYSINGETNDKYYMINNIYTRSLPYGKYSSKYPNKSVTDSGTMEVITKNSKTYVTFDNYKIDGRYPTQDIISSNNSNIYTAKQGYFLSGNIQKFVPFYATTSNYSYSYGIYTKDDIKKSNNKAIESYNDFLNGNFYVATTLLSNNVENRDGLSSASLGNIINPSFSLMPVDGPYDGGSERLITWNSKYFTLEKYDDNSYVKSACSSEIGYRCVTEDTIKYKYGVYNNDKENGLTTDELVNRIEIDKFTWYDNPKEALENGRIAAILAIDNDVVGNRVHRIISINLKINNNESLVGVVGTITHRVSIYEDKEKNIKYEPYKNTNYIKTIYDDEGNVIKAHSPYAIGASILITCIIVNDVRQNL